MTSPPTEVAEFNGLGAQEASALLAPACASSAWQRVVVASRPYRSVGEVAAVSDGVIKAMGWPDVEEALAAHPRIGERLGGMSREAGWSGTEQAGALAAPAEVATALQDGNVAYEERFGHVFLIHATARTAEEMLAALHERLTNDDEAERQVVRRELAAIVRVRLAKLLR
jgi:2-oxo-4-hydroxy-4-carboxy-5-ureidoimidazoline decarboxylase